MDVDAYTEASTTPPEPWLQALAEQTRATQSSPGMLTGPVAGRLLDMLVWASRAERVLEVGTFTGYSALTMAAAMPPHGRVTTLELDADRAAFARGHLDASPHGEQVEIRVGPALESLRALEGPFDLVFIDADKTGYPAYFEAALERLAPHGLIVLDNMLRGGRVLDEAPDESVRTTQELNARLAADERVVAVLLPVRDGMTVVRRRQTNRSGARSASAASP
jgi:caffeoyl-CoA O-methyltransferase